MQQSAKSLSRQQVTVAGTGFFDIPLFYAVSTDIVHPSSRALSEDRALVRQPFQHKHTQKGCEVRVTFRSPSLHSPFAFLLSDFFISCQDIYVLQCELFDVPLFSFIFPETMPYTNFQ